MIDLADHAKHSWDFAGCFTIFDLKFLHLHGKGAFRNYVDKILPIIDHLVTPCWHLWRNSFSEIRGNLHTVDIYIYKCQYFQYHLPTLSCKRCLWMPPYMERTRTSHTGYKLKAWWNLVTKLLLLARIFLKNILRMKSQFCIIIK